MREALESVVSPSAAQNILVEALERASLERVPEDIDSFRRFCESAFRTTVRKAIGPEAVEQIFERLGHVLWMATSDVQALEAARAWSRGTGQSGAIPGGAPLHTIEHDDDSGVRHVEAQALASSKPPPSRPGVVVPPPAPIHRDSPPPPPPSATRITLGRMRAPTLTQRAATPPPPERPSVPQAAMMRPSPVPPPPTQRPSPMPPAPIDRASPLPPSPTPVRRSSSPPAARVPSAVLVLTLDEQLVRGIRDDLAGQCPVRTIGTPTDLALALAKSGERLVVLVDTALPAIDLPTFAGLAPILPPSARVVLWGASPRQQQRLSAMFPVAAGWIASGPATRAGLFVLDLP